MALKIIEELRFLVELMLAVYGVAFIVFKKKGKFYSKFILGIILISGVSVSFPYIQPSVVALGNLTITIIFHISWYLFLAILIFSHSLICFKAKFNLMLLITTSGYAMQHIVYIVISEFIFLSAFNDFLTKNLFLYVLIFLAGTAIFYTPYFYFIIQKKSEFNKLVNSKKSTGFFIGFIFLILSAVAFMSQHIYRDTTIFAYQIIIAVIDLLTCLLVVLINFLFLSSSSYKKDKEIYNYLYQKEKEQYFFFKGNNELINIKYHDLKHQLKLMKDKGEINDTSYNNVKNSIKAFEAFINTGNEEVDAILTDFALKCQANNINFSPVVDGTLLSSYPVESIYILLSNIFDNAFNYVKELSEEYKYIRFVVKTVNNFIVIKESNYLKEKLILDNEGLPKTTNSDKNYHGFGYKSIRRFVKDNNGDMNISIDNNEFELTILLQKE